MKATDIDNRVFDCCICGQQAEGFGNNAAPVLHGRCCNECNSNVVIPTRIQRMCAPVDPRRSRRR
jgi:hypothetical protein